MGLMHRYQVFLLAGLAACTPQLDSSATKLKARDLSQNARTVIYRPTTRSSFTETIPFLGMVMPAKIVSLHFAVAGRLDSCPAREGSLVRKGDVICKLDTSVVDIEVQRARSARDAAKKVLASDFTATQKELYDSGVIGQVDYEKVRIQTETARATERDAFTVLELAEKKRAEHLLRAPWDGKVSGLSLASGQLLTPEVTVAYLGAAANQDSPQGAAGSDSGSTPFRVDLKLHASWFGRIKAGDTAVINQIAGRNLTQSLQGRVVEMGAAIAPETQMFRVSVALDPLPPGETALAQGMLVKGAIKNIDANQGVVIPAAALVEWDREDNGKVFVVGADDRLRLRALKVGRYSGDQVLVREGLEVGERLVRRWSAGLYEGLAVKPTPEQEESAPTPKETPEETKVP